jgi:dihydrofolate reductase
MTTIIAAIAANNALGKDNDLIWHLPADLIRFRKRTTGHYLLMGRNTYESIGRPLPNRTTVIITRNQEYNAPGCIIVHSMKAALEIAKNDTQPFVIGGAQIYEEAILFADQLDITEVHAEFEADVFFPKIDLQIWKEIKRETFSSDDKNPHRYSFVSYIRK